MKRGQARRVWGRRGRGAAIALLFVLLCSAAVGAQAEQPGLVNGSFEEGFTIRGASEVEVAIGWEVAYLEGDHPWCRSPCHRPEFKPEQQTQYVTDGQYAQRWFSTFARQFGVIWQRVPVVAGEWYRFSCDGYVISEPPGGHALMVGIQPWGADVFGRQMVWGRELQERDTWRRVEVVAQAWGDAIVVAVGTNNAWATRNNTAYVDSCQIERVEWGGGTCPECPEFPECPGDSTGLDYGRLREIVREELAERMPVRWPR